MFTVTVDQIKKTREHGLRSSANWLILDKLNDWVIDRHLLLEWVIPLAAAKAQSFSDYIAYKYDRMLPQCLLDSGYTTGYPF